MRPHSAFTLVEAMIIIVILGLLAVMAIPAYWKVRDNSIMHMAERGEHLNESQLKRYREIRREKDAEEDKNPSSAPAERVTPSRSVGPFQRVQIDGSTFYLVPKQDAKETEIAGKVFWLIPASN